MAGIGRYLVRLDAPRKRVSLHCPICHSICYQLGCEGPLNDWRGIKCSSCQALLVFGHCPFE